MLKFNFVLINYVVILNKGQQVIDIYKKYMLYYKIRYIKKYMLY